MVHRHRRTAGRPRLLSLGVEPGRARSEGRHDHPALPSTEGNLGSAVGLYPELGLWRKSLEGLHRRGAIARSARAARLRPGGQGSRSGADQGSADDVREQLPAGEKTVLDWVEKQGGRADDQQGQRQGRRQDRRVVQVERKDGERRTLFQAQHPALRRRVSPVAADNPRHRRVRSALAGRLRHPVRDVLRRDLPQRLPGSAHRLTNRRARRRADPHVAHVVGGRPRLFHLFCRGLPERHGRRMRPPLSAGSPPPFAITPFPSC